MTIDDESAVRQIIERKIADWDDAYGRKDVYGIAAHYLPSADDNTASFHIWANVMSVAESMEVHTTIEEFVLEANEATVHVRVQLNFVFPLTEGMIQKFLFGWLNRFVIVDVSKRTFVWIKTVEGWLCKSDDVIKSKVRMKRRTIRQEA